MENNISVRVVRAFYYDRKPQAVGSVINLPKIFALEMKAANKVTFEQGEDKPGRDAKKGDGNAR